MTTQIHLQYIFEVLYSKNKNFGTRTIKISVEHVNEHFLNTISKDNTNCSGLHRGDGNPYKEGQEDESLKVVGSIPGDSREISIKVNM